jgi:glycosyltransferase involved in cell wall biosynthesis
VTRLSVGGIRTYIQYNYPTLAEAGYRFTFVGPDEESFQKFGDELRGWEGVEFVGAPIQGRKCRLRSTVRRLLRSGRFTLIHSQGIKAAVQAVLANTGLGVPHIVTSHDVFRPVLAEGFRGRFKLLMAGWFLGQVDTVVTVGEQARQNHLEYLPRLARKPDRVVTIWPGINTRWYSEAALLPPSRLKEQFHLDPAVFLIGFLGRFMEQKGFLVLLDALEILRKSPPRVPYHVLAVASGDYEDAYRRAVERKGLSDVVSFHEFVPDPRSTLRDLDLLVMPSLWEALPVLPMEAMSLGTLVLGTDCIGLQEVLTGTPCPMVRAGDSVALAQGLRSAIENPWREAAAQFVAEARRRFEVRGSATRLLKLVRQMTGDEMETQAATSSHFPTDT